MPGPEPGVYLITALRGQGGPVGVVDLTEPSKPDPPMQPLSIVPRDSWHKWEVIRMPKGDGTYIISPVSSAYMYTGVHDDNLVVATNGQGQDVEWELTGFDNQVYAIHRYHGSQAWTMDPEQDPETEMLITVTTLQLNESHPPKATLPQLVQV